MLMSQKLFLTAPGILSRLGSFLLWWLWKPAWTSLIELEECPNTTRCRHQHKNKNRKKIWMLVNWNVKRQTKTSFSFFIFAFLTHLYLLQGFNAVITLSQMIGTINLFTCSNLLQGSRITYIVSTPRIPIPSSQAQSSCSTARSTATSSTRASPAKTVLLFSAGFVFFFSCAGSPWQTLTQSR